jgi:ribosomal protein L37E
MDCPRCGGSLERYSFGERETEACADCGFLDVPADHRYQLQTWESWDDALKRYADGRREN